MKKTLLLTALSLALLLTACGEKETQATASARPTPSAAASADPVETTQTTPESGGFVFQTGEHTVKVNDDMAGVLAALGEPQSYFEAASCAFDGLDKTYTYPGFVITTQPNGEQDIINSIVLTDDSVTTPEGLYIGCTAQEVVDVYGSGGEETGTMLSYVKGETALNFILKDGAVISIEYLPV